jgi:hypothetical protein
MTIMKLFTLLGAVSIGAVLSTPAAACSICRCGDPTFNALGKEGIAQNGLRLAIDWDQVDKTQGSGDEVDKLREQRITLLGAYAVSDRFSIFARVPYSERELTETAGGESERTRHSGLADPEIYGQMQLWASQFDGAVGIRSAIFAVAGVKTSWGENDASRDGERLDEHVQPGTGSTDWFAGLSGSYQIDPHSAVFASAQYRHTGRNDFGYQYGRIKLFNVAYEHKLGTRWDAVLEANYRTAQHDEVDSLGTLDPDTGGSIVYLTPHLLFDVGGGWVLRTSAQVPLSDSGLNGHQDEKAVVNFGITYLMSR